MVGLRRRRLIMVVFAVLLVIYLVHLIFNGVRSGQNDPKPVICEQPPEMRIQQREMLVKVKEAFESLPLSFFLCYDSLWGALNKKGPLPWDDTLHLCVLNEDMTKFEEAFIIRTFKNKGLSMAYATSTGEYTVKDGSHELPKMLITLFEHDARTGNMRRIGWKHRIIPPDSCEQIHCFPPHLVEKPLPLMPFMNMHLPVPREEIELQKYLYPDSWWKDLDPDECRHDPVAT